MSIYSDSGTVTQIFCGRLLEVSVKAEMPFIIFKWYMLEFYKLLRGRRFTTVRTYRMRTGFSWSLVNIRGVPMDVGCNFCIYILLGIHSLLLLAGFSWSGDFELKIWVDLLTSYAVIFWRNIWLHICGSEALTQCLFCVMRISGLWLVNIPIFFYKIFVLYILIFLYFFKGFEPGDV